MLLFSVDAPKDPVVPAVRVGPTLTRLVARGGDPAAVCAALHEAALGLPGVSASVLLQPDPASGSWLASSAAGLDALALGPWLADPAGAALAGRALGEDRPIVVSDLTSSVPDLAGRLGAPAVAVVPLLGARQAVGLLLLALAEGAQLDAEGASSVGDAMVLALDRARAQNELALVAEVSELMQAVARGGASELTLTPALDAMCRGVARLVAADRVEVWQHDRRARVLVCRAASVPRGPGWPAPVPTADAESLVVASMRRDRPELVVGGGPSADLGTDVGAVAPLRGRRRALGVLSASGIRVEPGAEAALVDRIGEIARQLAAVLENVQLLDDVLRSRRELEHVFNSLSDLVLVAGRDGRILEVNQAAAARLGHPRGSLVDGRLDDVLSPPLLAWIAGSRREVADRGRAAGVVTDAGLGGTFELTLTPLSGLEPAEGGLVLVARDLTAESRLEAERDDLAERLARSEKLLALGQFVAGVAHELNNPLQGVIGHLDLVRRTSDLPPPVRRDLGLVSREADRAARIVRGLLLFAGSGRLRRRSLSLNRVVARVLRLRAPAHKAAGITTSRVLAEPLPAVSGDGLLLQQALLNLVVNAEQAMAGPGRLVVETSEVAGGVQVAVEDSGPGLSAEARARLFEPFFTTKAVGKGTGLGLAIAYSIVSAHGGAIDADNHAGGGARFVIRLPAGASGPGRVEAARIKG